MKVLLITKHPGTGGAAIASSRLLEALREKKLDAKMLVQDGENRDKGIYATGRGTIKHWKNLGRFIIERLAFLRQERSSSIRFLFSLANTGESIAQHPLVKEADILHLHWINAGFLSLKSLRELFSLGKPIVWTFHDMWTFTGGCHYALDCTQYTLECGNCPYLKQPAKNDLSQRIWRKKAKIFSDQKVHVVTPSKWLEDCVKASSLLKNWPVSTIHNPVNAGIFKPANQSEACARLGLDPTKKYILFGAATMKNVLKGFSYFLEASKIIAAQTDQTHIDQVQAEDVEILLFGKTKEDVAASFPIPTRNIAFVKSMETIVDLYSVAHLFVIPSLQDNLPNTIVESMLCGTPVVGFDTGGIPEMIAHKENGYLAEFKSSENLAEGISWVLSNPDYEKLSDHTRKLALERFSMDRSVDMHVDLYTDILNGEKQAE